MSVLAVPDPGLPLITAEHAESFKKEFNAHIIDHSLLRSCEATRALFLDDACAHQDNIIEQGRKMNDAIHRCKEIERQMNDSF